MNAQSNTQTAAHFELVAESGANPSHEQPLRFLSRVLKGRVLLAVVLSASLAVIGAVIGYAAPSPVYQSTGLVRVEGELPSVLYTTRENGVPPLFNAFVASQETLLESRQVIESAASDPALIEAGWRTGPDGLAALEKAIATTWRSGEQIITVTGSANQPETAQAAVNAVLRAYQNECVAAASPSYGQTEATLVARERDLEHQIQALREQILEASDQYGSEALQSLHDSKVQELVAIDRKLAELQIARTRLETGQPASGMELTGGPAQGDRELDRLQREELALLAEMRSLGDKYGKDHPIIRELRRQIEAIRLEIALRSNARAGGSPASTDGDAGATPIAPITSLAELDTLETQYQSMRDRVREETAALGRKRAAIAGLTEELREVSDRLVMTRQRLDELRVESTAGGNERIRIQEFGELPIAPAIDRRRGLAGALGLMGFLGGIGVTILLGLIDRRLRFVTDFEILKEPAPVLISIPDLHDGDAEATTRSTRAVHQLRNLLEVQRATSHDAIVAVSSTDRGEGKTSLAIALGDSFAAAGRKTLLIDADIARHSLTDEMDLAGAPGLCEAIGPNDQSAKVHRSGDPNLWIMPIGAAGGLDPEHLSRDRIDKLFSTLRTRFDAVVVDTGPATSSVEASLICALSDRTILVIARNQTAGCVETAMERLERINGRLAGLVFNRSIDDETDSESARRTGAHAPSARLLGRRGGGPERHRRLRIPHQDEQAGKRAA